MVIKVYVASSTGSVVVKKHQQAVVSFLEANRLSFQEVDITMREEERLWMCRNVPQDKHPEVGNPLTPQIFNGDRYCGDYEDFFQSKENNSVFAFLVREEEEVAEDRRHSLFRITSSSQINSNAMAYRFSRDHDPHQLPSPTTPPDAATLRLVNGPTSCSGRVELFHDDSWGTVCDDGWTMRNTEVVCKSLDCGIAMEIKPRAFYGEGKDQIWLDDVRCTGQETSLKKCDHRGLGTNNCGHAEDVGVICSDHIKLLNGTQRCEGRIEVKHGGQWRKVCNNDWSQKEHEVLCQELRCGVPLVGQDMPDYGDSNAAIGVKLNCLGNETSVLQCVVKETAHTCHSASLLCTYSKLIRLVNGTTPCSGRVEVLHEGQWGTVCDDSWGLQEAEVACREMKCGTALGVKYQAHFGQGAGPILLDDLGCNGQERSLLECKHAGFVINDCSHTEDAGVICSGQPEIKLINGTDRCTGRVEVQHDGQWGTVCDDFWDIKDAQVVCRAMDCGTPLRVKPAAYFGQGKGNVWLDDVNCSGNETSLMHCKHTAFGESNCGHAEDAGVQCSMTIRLLNGSDHCSGRVEIFQEGHWAPVYNSNWGLNEALVVCREMQCGEPVLSSTPLYFGQASQVTGYTTTCNGRETSISQCSLRGYAQTSRDHAVEATVVCSGNMRLANGSNKCTGRVEVYQNGQWGTICDDTWDINDAAVVCTNLQCGKAQKIPEIGFFGRGSRTLIREINCNGHEHSLDECKQTSIGSSTCNSTTVAGLLCSDGFPTRLVHTTGHCFGRVEVQHAGQWGTLCGKDWSMSDAEVVCSLLGCGEAVSISGNAQFGEGTGPIWEASDLCFNNEASIFKCSVSGFNGTSCGHEQDAGVVCTELIRLVNGRSQCSGRLEILHNGVWGTICDDEWEMSNAEVVCRQIGCGQALSFTGGAEFGAGSGPIWLDNVVCTGEEDAITQCSHQNYGENNCGHSEDVGIICLGNLPKPHISLNPGPEVNFGDRVEITCSVLTDHLGGMYVLQKTPGPFKMQRYSESETVTFTFPKTNLSHGGLYHCHYQKRIQSKTIDMLGDAVELKVTVKLPQPIISMPSGGPMMLLPTNKIEVKGGSNFAISCSIFSNYEGGSFYLRKSNTTATKPQAALSHSIIQVAYFDFSDVTEQDQGDYTCIYYLNISTQSYHSVPSKTLQVIVSGSAVSSTVTGTMVGLALVLTLSTIVYLCWRRRGMASRAMVQFTSRVGEVIKEDTAEIRGGSQSERDYNTLANEYDNGSNPEDKGTNEVESQNTLERNATEDLTGRVCYEFEPLINS
ncbi:unnamed protein product [Lota lota]